MGEEKPRYSRVSDILDLAIFMSSKMQGVTIVEIMERYNVSRRTAERMRDSLTCIFPQIDKIKSLNRKKLNSLENNIELYMQTEGYAVRQMPKYVIAFEILEVIRDAVQNSKMVTCVYHDKDRLLEPLGMIYGEKIYLVAREKAKGEGIYTYLLHKFNNLKLTDKTFDKKGFNLQEYTNQSFGVYHGDILNVKLSFDKEIAEDVLKYNFHPTQKIKSEEDGSVTVKFKASGEKEIIWHVFRWGKQCKIAAPESLKNYYKEYLKENLKNFS